jgi:hypothetical protein
VVSSYDIFGNREFENMDKFYPGWSGALSMGTIHGIIKEETKYFKDLTILILDSTYKTFAAS